MKLESSQDIEAPIEFVFSQVTDFDAFARQAMRRGAEVIRVDDLEGPCAGMQWKTAFTFRGKRRNMMIHLAELDVPNGLLGESKMSGLNSEIKLELMQLSPRRTRLNVALELMPQSLAARLLVQSLKLAKNNLSRRINKRLKQFARDAEGRYSQIS